MMSCKDIVYDSKVELEDVIKQCFYLNSGDKVKEVRCMSDNDIADMVEEISQNITLYQIAEYKKINKG